MKRQWACFHGHRLDVGADVVDDRDVQCPLCGSIGAFRKDIRSRDPEAFAVTVVPVSFVGSDNSSEPLSEGDLSSSSVNTSNEPTDSEVDTEQGSRPAGDASSRDPKSPHSQTASDDPSDTGLVDEKNVSADATPTKPAKRKREYAPPQLPGYEIMEELGRGGMGVVYKAYDEKRGRDVALKTLQRMSPDDIVRFKQEFRALADIAHPNLASLYELLSDGRTWCFTMEILNGVELLDYVWSEFDSMKLESRRATPAESPRDVTRLTLRRINRLYESLKQLAIGLNQLHRVGKLHSDIKPSNVLVTTEGRVTLVDFGLIAEISKGEDGRLQRGIQGTPHYMSPEQAACGQLSGASDWYAVGVMLYEVLTGRLPVRDKAVRIMLRKQYEIPLEPIKRQPRTPPELNELCMALLEIDPRNRPSVSDVLRAVDAEDLAVEIEAAQSANVVQSVDLVGREEHFEVLNRAFSDVKNGLNRSVFVHGRSGMGKSVLIRRFIDSIRHHSDTIVLEGRCYEQESVPFKSLDDLIDSLVIYLATLPDTERQQFVPDDIQPLTRLFPVLGPVFGVSQESQQTIENADPLELRQRAMNGLRQLFFRLGQSSAVVLYIDDLQWGDEDSANLLADLMRPPNCPRVLLVGSYRREDINSSPSLLALSNAYEKGKDRPHRSELPIEPLSLSHATRLATMLLDHSARRLADRVAQESGGSPFFVWELAQHIKDDADDADVSLELDEVIWSRVRRLPNDTRQLLEVFAVSGRPMRASEAYLVIDATTHGPGLLAQLRTSNFVRTTEQEDDTVVETYHDRIRESVVNHLANAKVRGHYLKLALVIEQSGGVSANNVTLHIDSTPAFAEPGNPPELDKRQWQRVFDLAYFFDAAEKTERAMPYALIAAESAWRQNAYDVAEQQFEIALRGAASATDAVRFRIAEGLGDVLMIRGKYDQASQQFQIARSLAVESQTLARIDSKRGYQCFKQGDMANSVRHIARALTELGNPPPSNKVTQALALAKESCVQVLHTYFPRLFTHRRDDSSNRAQMDMFRARAYEGLGYPYWFSRGPIPTLWTHLRHMNLAEKYPPSPELGRAYSMHAVMITAIPLAERGAAYAERSFQIHEELGDRLGQGKARSFQTFSLLALGRFRDGVKSGREAVRLLEQAGDVWEANMARIIVSQPLYFLGDLKNAHLEAKRAYEIGIETGDFSAIAIALFFWMPACPNAIPRGALQAERERTREDPLSTSAAIQGRGLELLLREDDPVSAAKVIQESLDVAKARGLRNPCVFSGVTWKATALRLAAERAPKAALRKTALALAKKATRDALRLTKKYLTCRPRALRENAEIAVMEGRESLARKFFDESIRVAKSQDAAYELAHTQLARGKAGLEFGWPDSEQEAAAGADAIRQIEDFDTT